MKEQRSEDGKEFLVLLYEISQWARGSTVLSTMNEAEKHLASKHIYAYLLQLFQYGSRHSIRATHRLQDYIGLLADRRYVTQIEAQTKNLLHNAMDKLCNELGMHCIALKIRDKFIDPPDLLIIPEHS
ncbi:hypothetical protein T12_17045 [Trichinella patagoniensis]|uniref:Uncharacterized protein n=1 Tax=Trichinella patagoniensis TaxID=990121 RepID=A0A0V0ZIL1_9BILA|nr:hypothetical protein T12_17045 [Trichinella patagoniensis]